MRTFLLIYCDIFKPKEILDADKIFFENGIIDLKIKNQKCAIKKCIYIYPTFLSVYQKCYMI